MNSGTPSPAATSLPEDPIAQLLKDAENPETSSFDYVIVGSGAGGGPLAARLAEAGKKVLVLEAGQDPALIKYPPDPKTGRATHIPGEVSRIPGYYAAASEDAEMSWMFSVRHYDDHGTQEKDDKYNKSIDPNTGGPLSPKFRDPHPGGGKGGIFYPRSSGIGGCTAHHAMITIRPNDKDWNDIAKLTGDASWCAGAMGGYFAKLERNQYLAAYDRFLRNAFGKVLGFFYRSYRWLRLLLDPRAVLDEGGHGFEGWAPTNLIDPFLVTTIAEKDRPFIKAIVKAALGVIHGNYSLITWLKGQFVKSRVVQAIDFNDVNTRLANPEGVFLIPLGIEGDTKKTDQGQPAKGRRFGVREFLLNTRSKFPERLVIRSGAHVKCVLFEQEKQKDGPEIPRAIGVECVLGDHLYEASPVQNVTPPKSSVRYFAKTHGGEIILCGGAFNTPQLLMLSGIGEKEHLAEHGITQLCGADGMPLQNTPVIDLPGVGRNLQDRYEVTVVSELDKDFSTLDGVSFEPGDSNDPARSQWLRDGTGLYATNGGTLAVIRRSQPVKDAGEPEPDLFTFGAPAAFRGYYWNWSRELFKATLGDKETKHRLWSWVILKAYTHNADGIVRLRTASPFDMPEICFDSFNEKAGRNRPEFQERLMKATGEYDALVRAGKAVPKRVKEEKAQAEADWAENEQKLANTKRDLAALVDAVRFMRKVNAGNPKQFVREIQPGETIRDESVEMEEWIKTQAWGHHCSCTCRIGSDSWNRDTSKLTDREAVLDSRFQVHGVKDLRIVDASIFPKIPGYFIFAPIYMVSEKAADTLIQDSLSAVYPDKFEADEAAAVRERRRKAGRPVDPQEELEIAAKEEVKPDPARLPNMTVGLALSGGGIRSSTFALGVLQTLAERNRVRDLDFLSTVSGGGFIGSFLGRLFTRESVRMAGDPCERVQETLKNSNSAPINWLRTKANYIFASGSSDLRLNLAVLWRNIVAVYLVVGALLFTVFGLLAWLPDGVEILSNHLGTFQLRNLIEPLLVPPVVRGIALSVWWWLPVLALGLGLLPPTVGYWLAPRAGSYRPYPAHSLFAWLVLLYGTLIAFKIPHGALYSGAVTLVLVLAWVWQEAARWGAMRGRDTEDARRQVGAVVRNRILRSIGEAMFVFLGLAAWVVLDTLALLFAKEGLTAGLTVVAAAFTPLLPFLHKLAMSAKQALSPGGEKKFSLQRVATALGIPLAIFLLFVVDVHAHRLFIAFPGWGWGFFIIVVTGAFSAANGRAFDFLNLSSLQATYSSRLARTFQGASNEQRVYAPASSDGHDVGVANPEDDIPWHEYHPEQQGGPLHLINVTVNETVDAASEREIRERKGLPMCVTPHGVSVGRRYFARWSKPDSFPRWQKFRRWLAGVDGDDATPFLPWCAKQPDKAAALTALDALPVSSDPRAFHVLKTKKSRSAEVESLTLGEWTGISGAAFSTGVGRDTKLSLALFMGLTNVRLGYWWDSGIHHDERPGRYPEPLWRRIKRFPVTLFRAQSMLLAEWRARFHGPSRWFWYLSDGGHFEVTGLYEMLRRRLKFMIVSDAGEDPNYQWNDVSLLTQQVREDFGAEIEWINPKPAGGGKRKGGWADFSGENLPPKWIQAWIKPDQIGFLNDIQRENSFHAALARVTYHDRSGDVSWILLLKPSLSNVLTQDIINYGKVNTAFPQTPTFDQVFDDIQWESYRALGQQIAARVLK